MKLSVVGTGYVGLVAGTCFADGGNHVICVDIDEKKITALKKGDVPIYEPGLAEIIQRNSKAGRLEFTTDLALAVKNSQVIFLAVGTPEAVDGSADLSAILSVARSIGRMMDGYRIIVTKSTVPVGTHKRVAEAIRAETKHNFDVVSNPEFMKEGAAILDFTKPDRVVLGTTNPSVVLLMKQLYAPFMAEDQILVMDPASAEMTKYAANTMLAARISFMNEVANLCKLYGADVEEVRKGVGADQRIGSAFLYPGIGYGGSCFPKDVSAFVKMGDAVGYETRVANAVQATNRLQPEVFAEQLVKRCKQFGATATASVWGLTFKGQTDDVRESAAIIVVRRLLETRVRVRAHDPKGIKNAERELGSKGIEFFEEANEGAYDAIHGTDLLVVLTDWPVFRTPDFDRIKQNLRHPVVFDGRNLYDPAMMSKMGFEYHSVGRPSVGH